MPRLPINHPEDMTVTDAEKNVLAAARRYAEALKQTWSETPDQKAVTHAQSDLLEAAMNLVPKEEWMALRRAKEGGR